MNFRCWVPLVALLACHSLAGQKAPAKQPNLVLRSTTRLVEVNVVVHDKKGHFIRDLTKENFVLREDGKPQEIRVFTVQAKDVQPRAVETTAFGTFSNRPAAQAATGVTVILFDCLNTMWGDQSNARRRVLDFLKQIQPHDKVALYALTRELRVLHDYTQDAGALVKALTAFRGIDMPDVAASVPTMLSTVIQSATAERNEQDTAEAMAAIEGLINSLKEEAFNAEKTRVIATLTALQEISNHIAGVPGRKNLVWVSGSFPLLSGYFEAPDDGGPALNSNDSPYSAKTPSSRDPRASRSLAVASAVQRTKHGRGQTYDLEFQRTTRALNAANLAVYPVDARGLSTSPNVWTNITTMKELAADTGGKAYYNTNDIMNSVREAVEDSEVSYTLAYYPKEQNGEGRYHTIKVKIDRPGLVLRHRHGYYDLGEATPGAVPDSTLADTVWSPLDATGVPLDARVERRDPNDSLLDVKIDVSKISLEPQGERRVGKLDVLLVQTDNQGRQYEGRAQTLDLNFQEQEYRTAVERGLYYRNTFRPKPGATTLRVIVRDTQTGSIGRVMIPFDKIP